MRLVPENDGRACDEPTHFNNAGVTSVLLMVMATPMLPDADADSGWRWLWREGHTYVSAIASARPMLPMAVAMRDDDRSGSADVGSNGVQMPTLTVTTAR